LDFWTPRIAFRGRADASGSLRTRTSLRRRQLDARQPLSRHRRAQLVRRELGGLVQNGKSHTTSALLVKQRQAMRWHRTSRKAHKAKRLGLGWPSCAAALRVSGASPSRAITPCVGAPPPSAPRRPLTHICLRTPRGVRLGKIPHFHPPTHTAARRCSPRIALIPPPRARPLIPSYTAATHCERLTNPSVGDRHRRRRRRHSKIRQLQAQEGG